MSDVIFRATTRGGKNFVEVIDTGTDFDRYEIKMNDSIDYSDTIKGVLAMLIHHSGWKSGMFDKIEFDDTGMSLGEQYLQIMKMINKEFGFLYKSPTGSRERQYYFDIIRFISRNIKNGTMSVEELIEKSKDALRAKGIMSSRRINSSQKGFENVVEGTQYDDYHIDTRGQGILSVENIIEEIEGRGNQAVLTVQTSDGSTNHSQFGSKDWKEYKDSVNDTGNAITDVWITEVEGGSYVRNSRRPIKSGINDECIGESADGTYAIYKNDTDKVFMFSENGRVTKEVDYNDDEVDGVLENWIEIYDVKIEPQYKNFVYSSRRPIKSGWERTDMASGPIWDKDNWRIIERREHFTDEDEKYYLLRDKSDHSKEDLSFDTLAEAMDHVDININSSRRPIKSSSLIRPYRTLWFPLPFYKQNDKEFDFNGLEVTDKGVKIHGYDYSGTSTNIDVSDNSVEAYDTKHHINCTGNYDADLILDFVRFFKENVNINYYLNNFNPPVDMGYGQISMLSEEDTNKLRNWADSHKFVRSSRKITSARYIATDPESGEVLGSADTYEEAVNEWGEDVTITDSETTENQEDGGLFQSRKSTKSDLNVNDESAYWDGVEDGVNGLSPADEDDPDYMKGWKSGKARLKSMNIQDYNVNSSRRPIKSSLQTEVVENFPEYMVNYAVYGERLDVTDEDVRLYEEWRERNGYGTCFGTGSVYDESYFSNNPAFGLPCTVIPVVFEVSNGVTSSKKLETTKQFMTRILSELETGEITEDEASKEIAEANDVNIGYAKQILSNYIADKDRYITSGMLELGEALNMEFNPDGNLDSWSVDFVSDPEKPAPTLGGELVRAARYIIAAFRDDGEKIGWGYAKEMLNPAARFIVENTDFTGNDSINDMLEGNVPDDESYREWIDEFEVEFADYLRDHEDYFHKLNKKDFTEGKNEGDSFSPVKELLISDDEGNDYFFEYIDGQFVCTGVDEGTSPEYTEGDVITAEDYMFDDINFDEEFGKFEQDGFIYSWEDGDGESVTISDVSLKNPMFWYDDILTEEEIANLIENGVKIYDPSKGTSDTNRRELKISDIM